MARSTLLRHDEKSNHATSAAAGRTIARQHAEGALRRTIRSYRAHKYAIIMFLPGFMLFLLFHYVPMYGLLIAFKDYKLTKGILGSPWVGIDNFRFMFSGHGLTNALRNTVVISLLKYVFVFPAPIALAILLNEVRLVAFRRVVQTVSYLPHFFSWVILSGILFTFLSRAGGFNQLLGLIGIGPIDWLIDPEKFYGVIILSDIWHSIGWGSIVYFAALAAIDPTLYEAAIADGASRWRRIWHITLPSITPVITTMLLLSIGHFLSVGFDQIYNLTTPTTSSIGDILDTYVLRRLLSMDYQLGVAASIFSSVFGLLLVIAANRLVKWYNEDHGLW